jgi:SecD/SecF fusion protein
VEFRGGYAAQFTAAGQTVNPSELVSKLEQGGIRGANVKFGGEGTARFAEITAPADGALKDLSEKDAIAKITEIAGFKAADIKGSSSVGPAIQAETIRNAIMGVLISSALIIVYLAMRFGFGLGGFASGLRFGISAIGALAHDVLVVLGVTAAVGYFFNWEISALFITSMLTVIGFSVHDTIVIFDRIRENLHRPIKGEDFSHLLNRSISQSYARSINTSMTVIVTLLVLLLAGTTTPELKLFCATMLAGIVSGTYSSIYNASPILFLWDRAIGKKKGEEATLLGLANEEAKKHSVIVTQASASPAAAGQVTGASGRTYGQVRRRANSQVKSAQQELDDL